MSSLSEVAVSPVSLKKLLTAAMLAADLDMPAAKFLACHVRSGQHFSVEK